MSAPYSFPFAPGTVLTDVVPRGFRLLRRRVDAGRAAELPDLGAEVHAWAVQRRSGVAVRTTGGSDAPPVTAGFEGTVVLPLVRLGAVRLEIAAPVRVTAVVREADAVGFAYGTLRGHPEVGEESFVVRRVGDRVVFELRVLSRPAFPYALAAPLGRAVQARITRRYLRWTRAPR